MKKRKNNLYRFEVIDIRNNKITDRFKTTKPISIMEAIIKHGESLMGLDWREAIELWDVSLEELEEYVRKKRKKRR